MENHNRAQYHVAIIGGGPAGLFAAKELAEQGIHSIIFNRDIKPGGLAEYGIYPSKTKMKDGLRNQFRQILGRDLIEYYGNITVADDSQLTLARLRSLGFQALLVTVGAQSTKRLGIPGEDLTGVYHAKDLVYHYNLLPPYSETAYHIGKRVAVIGVGNVMVDVARWLIDEKGAEEVTAVARRGPADVKFDRKELEDIISCLNMEKLANELRRIEPVAVAVGQEPDKLLQLMMDVAEKMNIGPCNSSLSLRFLSTPVGILGNSAGQVCGLQVEENTLALSEDGQSRPVGTGVFTTLDVDTVIFAIGDVVDHSIGLPVVSGEYAKNPQPRFPVDGLSYEVFDPKTQQPVEDVFLAGWARKPSVGLVGVARRDATNAAQVVAAYLKTLLPLETPISDRVRETMMKIPQPVVDKQALQRLDALERERAQELGVRTFKFATNDEMLQVLDLV